VNCDCFFLSDYTGYTKRILAKKKEER
jgi:hypothetical protein